MLGRRRGTKEKKHTNRLNEENWMGANEQAYRKVSGGCSSGGGRVVVWLLRGEARTSRRICLSSATLSPSSSFAPTRFLFPFLFCFCIYRFLGVSSSFLSLLFLFALLRQHRTMHMPNKYLVVRLPPLSLFHFFAK